jgi:hypothetical protein
VEALGYPWPAGYARRRQAEALLAQGAPQQAAGAALTRAWTLARGFGARLLVAEMDALGRRARIELVLPEAAPDGPAQPPAPPPDEFGLTPSGARGLGAGRRRPHQPPDRLEMVAISAGWSRSQVWAWLAVHEGA